METPDIRRALSYRKIAVVGLSPDPERPSHDVTRYLIQQGYEVTGVRPGAQEILGRPCFGSLAEVPGPIEIVDVFRAPEHVPGVVDEAIARHSKVLWLQEGVTHPGAEVRAREAGMIVISNRCILKEHLRINERSHE